MPLFVFITIILIFFISTIVLTVRFIKLIVSKRDKNLFWSIVYFMKDNIVFLIPVIFVSVLFVLLHIAFYSFDNPSVNPESDYKRNFSTPFEEISDIESYKLGGIDISTYLFFKTEVDVVLKNEDKYKLVEDSLTKYWKAEQFKRSAESRSFDVYSEALENIDVNDLIVMDYFKVSEKDSTRDEYYYHYMQVKSKGLHYFNYGDF